MQSREKPSPRLEYKFASLMQEARDPKPVDCSFSSDLGRRNTQGYPASSRSMAARDTGSLLGWKIS